MKNIYIFLTMLILSIAFFSCKKEKKVNPEFKWFANGNVFHYDYYTAAGVQKNYSSIAVADSYLLMDITDTARISQINLDNIYGKYVVNLDGLYATAPIDCQEGFFVATFNYLYAPNSPAAGQQIPVYYCRNNLDYNIAISAIDQTVTVPYGTFTTYVMQYKNGDKGYWDNNHGLIMYEVYDQHGNIAGTLKLNSVTTN